MTANNVIFTQVGVTKKNGQTYTNPKTVTLMTQPNDEENLTKTLITIPVPKTTANQVNDTSDPNYGANATKIIDILNKVEQRITLNGYLYNGSQGSDSSSTASGRKEDLKKIFLGGGTFYITYEGSSIEVNGDKLSIRRISEDASGTTDTAEYSVKITLIRGVDY